MTHKPGAAVTVPTLWIVLGPLGQSVTTAGNLGTQAAHVLPEPYAAGAASSPCCTACRPGASR